MNQENDATTCPGNWRWKFTLKRSFVAFLKSCGYHRRGAPPRPTFVPAAFPLMGMSGLAAGNGFLKPCCGMPCKTESILIPLDSEVRRFEEAYGLEARNWSLVEIVFGGVK